MEDMRQDDHMDEGGGKEITEMPAEHINGENAQRDMSISEFMQYIKTIKRAEQRETYENMACWRGVLVWVEGELWGMTELSDAANKGAEEEQHPVREGCKGGAPCHRVAEEKRIPSTEDAPSLPHQRF